MNPTVPELLRQGLMMTVLGMGLVFAGLAALWGLMALLTRLFRPEPEAAAGAMVAETPLAATPAPATIISSAAALTAERGRVAAIVAGALMANAVSLLMEAPAGPVFEHGRTAPIWVSANRARALQSWQPPRFDEPTAMLPD